jgi:hypothetical protein
MSLRRATIVALLVALVTAVPEDGGSVALELATSPITRQANP